MDIVAGVLLSRQGIIDGAHSRICCLHVGHARGTMQNGHMSAAIRFLSLAIDHLSGAPTVPSPVGRFPSNFAD